MTHTIHFTVENKGERLDRFLASQETGLSRSHLQRLIADGLVLVNDLLAKPGSRLNAGDRVALQVPEPVQVRIEAEEIPLKIVYQDQDLLVIDKPPGLVVHPAPGHPSGTVVNAVLGLVPDLAGIKGTIRPGIVHRLDKDTSGLMVVAKNDRSQIDLSRQIQDRQTLKEYTTLVQGRLSPKEGSIEAPIGRDPAHRQRMAVTANGREARTAYQVLEYIGDNSLLTVRLQTGRTHQIRVHLAAIGFPVVGDPVYGAKSSYFDRQFLHASRLGFRLPSTGEYREFASPLPPDLEQGLVDLRRSL